MVFSDVYRIGRPNAVTSPILLGPFRELLKREKNLNQNSIKVMTNFHINENLGEIKKLRKIQLDREIKYKDKWKQYKK